MIFLWISQQQRKNLSCGNTGRNALLSSTPRTVSKSSGPDPKITFENLRTEADLERKRELARKLEEDEVEILELEESLILSNQLTQRMVRPTLTLLGPKAHSHRIFYWRGARWECWLLLMSVWWSWRDRSCPFIDLLRNWQGYTRVRTPLNSPAVRSTTTNSIKLNRHRQDFGASWQSCKILWFGPARGKGHTWGVRWDFCCT